MFVVFFSLSLFQRANPPFRKNGVLINGDSSGNDEVIGFIDYFYLYLSRIRSWHLNWFEKLCALRAIPSKLYFFFSLSISSYISLFRLNIERNKNRNWNQKNSPIKSIMAVVFECESIMRIRARAKDVCARLVWWFHLVRSKNDSIRHMSGWTKKGFDHSVCPGMSHNITGILAYWYRLRIFGM